MKDITGQKFNHLTAIQRARTEKHKSLWIFKCRCGIEKEIAMDKVLSGHTKSCGCTTRARTHGMSKTLEFKSWSCMKARCYNPNATGYIDYGGRGIRVCNRWLGEEGFINFYADIGPRPSKEYTLERVNNDGNYEPSNCKWATKREQVTNRRKFGVIEHRAVSELFNEIIKRNQGTVR